MISMTQVFYPNSENWIIRYSNLYEGEGPYVSSDSSAEWAVERESTDKLHAYSHKMTEDFEGYLFLKIPFGVSISNEIHLCIDIRSTLPPSHFGTFQIYLEDCNGQTATYSLHDEDLGTQSLFALDSFVKEEGFNRSFVTCLGIKVADPIHTDKLLDIYIENYTLSSAPVPTYILPQKVINELRIYTNNGELFRPTPYTSPSLDTMCEWIVEEEDHFEKATRRNFGERRATNELLDIESLMSSGIQPTGAGAMMLAGIGLGAQRGSYGSGLLSWGAGIPVKLRNRSIRKFDPQRGDKLEVCWIKDDWRDVSSEVSQGGAWIDYNRGMLYLRQFFVRDKAGIRITYRYGEEDIPPSAKKAISLMVGRRMYATDKYKAMLPQATEFGPTLAETLDRWNWEIKDLMRALSDTISVGGF